MDDEHETSALHSRRKKSSMSLSSCFSGGHRRGRSFDVSSSSSPARSPSPWMRSKTHEQLPVPVPGIKGKYKKIIPRVGRHRRHSSAEFSYDPLSYALNFEDNDEPSEWDREPLRSFSSRLPASPPGERATTVEPLIAFETSPAGRMTSMNRRASELLLASRALAVAEVQKSLELSSPGTNTAVAREVRQNLELPTPPPPRIEASRRSSAEVGEVRRTLDLPTPRKVIANASGEPRKSNERSTPRAAAAEVRRNLKDVTPSHSWQVRVELF